MTSGEEGFLTLKKENIRASKDWVESRWADRKAKPNILSCIAEKMLVLARNTQLPHLQQRHVGFKFLGYINTN